MVRERVVDDDRGSCRVMHRIGWLGRVVYNDIGFCRVV